MTILTVEGIVENGMIRLAEMISLPEHTRVYVIVPEMEYGKVEPRTARIASPRLAIRERVADFRMEVSEDTDDASIQ